MIGTHEEIYLWIMVLTAKDREGSEIMPCKLTCKPAMDSWMMVQTMILLSKTQKNLLLRPILLTEVSAHSCTGSQSPRVPTGWQERGQITSAQALVCMTGEEPWLFHTFHYMCVFCRVRLFCNPMDVNSCLLHPLIPGRFFTSWAIGASRIFHNWQQINLFLCCRK